MTNFNKSEYITIISKRQKVVISVSSILYIIMEGKSAEIHLSDGKIYSTRMTFAALEEMLGDGFIKAHRGCIVSAMAIHEISDMIDLVNGEKLEYACRRKNTIIESLQTSRKWIIKGFDHDGVPDTEEQYHDYYRSFDAMPFAFTDIEMVFNEECKAVDWIFRYANEALARLEKLPLEKLIGQSFGTLFSNMDAKWLKGYERSTLYGETLELMDYSPEIDTHLKVICFPTFKGHCGCILFDVDKIWFVQHSEDSARHWRDITQSCRITSKVNNIICAAYLGGISDFYYKLRPRSKERGLRQSINLHNL